MIYEPKSYIYEYEIGAILMLIAIMIRYFSMRKFPNQKNKLFSGIICVTLADAVLDIVSSLNIEYALMVPPTLTFLCNTLFYMLQIALPMLMALYIYALTDHLSRERMKRKIFVFLPGIVMLLLLLSDCLTKWFFYVDPVRGYVHGEAFVLTYVFFAFYMGIAFVFSIRNRNRMKKNEFQTICAFLTLSFASMLIQFFYPPLLISGVAIILSVVLMYYTIQKPESMFDSATGAFSYDAMLEFLHDRVQDSDKVQMIAVKITNMRRINKILGIENGSTLLRQICQFMCGSTDDAWVFRMRGGCFVTITRNEKDYESACRSIEARMTESWMVGQVEIMVKATLCCISTAKILKKPITPEEAVSYLDMAFFQNEKAGNQLSKIVVGTELLDKIERMRQVEDALRASLETGKYLELYFQPLWSLTKKKFANIEILLRLHHPVLGSIPPDEFIPIAESSGLITALDEFVLRKSCEFIAKSDIIRQCGIEIVQINLSALEFMHNRFSELLRGIIHEYRINPDCLMFEITETAATESYDILKKCMMEIKKEGCRFALDDFGTGYANITKVISLPFSMVKLDKSLLYCSGIVLEDLIRMFQRIHMYTVVEGAETQKQIDMISPLDAGYIQGYFYARPMPTAEIKSWYESLGAPCKSFSGKAV